jgi:hypothetical protein
MIKSLKIGLSSVRELRLVLAKARKRLMNSKKPALVDRRRRCFEVFRLAVLYIATRPELLIECPERKGWYDFELDRAAEEEIAYITVFVHSQAFVTRSKEAYPEFRGRLVAWACCPSGLREESIGTASEAGLDWLWLASSDIYNFDWDSVVQAGFMEVLEAAFPGKRALRRGAKHEEFVLLVDADGLPRLCANVYPTSLWNVQTVSRGDEDRTSLQHPAYRLAVKAASRWMSPRWAANLDLRKDVEDGWYPMKGLIPKYNPHGYCAIKDGLFVEVRVTDNEGIEDYVRFTDGDCEMDGELPPQISRKFTRRYMQDDARHRVDGPAIVEYDGERIIYEGWHLHGLVHREDGPAVVKRRFGEDGAVVSEEWGWWRNGRRHRTDGPQAQRWETIGGKLVLAREWWYVDGLLHNRDGGPAEFKLKDGEETRWWNRHGEKHRIGGPAVVFPGGESWWENGKRHRVGGPAFVDDRKEEWYRHGGLHRADGPALVDKDGLQEWHLFGRLHRRDGPARIRSTHDGKFESAQWWLHGELQSTLVSNGDRYWGDVDTPHRVDGPAVRRADGQVEWYREGKLHRDDGPALLTNTGDRWWYKSGDVHREDGPAASYSNGTVAWYFMDKLHRADGPAVTTADGTCLWYREGVLHRDDGPAVIRPDGTQEWFREGCLSSPSGTSFFVSPEHGEMVMSFEPTGREQLDEFEFDFDYEQLDEFEFDFDYDRDQVMGALLQMDVE